MPVWNAESDAKLLLGVLAWLRDSKIKLDTEWLAKYMGEDCTACAINNHIVRIRRQVEGPTNENKTPEVTPKKAAAKTPSKRKAASTPGSARKKNKGKIMDSDGDVNISPVKKEKVKVEDEVKVESIESDWPNYA